MGTRLPIAHEGERKLRMKANPLGQPFTGKKKEVTIREHKESSIQYIRSVNSQRANRALFLNSFGVAMGSATIIKTQSLTHLGFIFHENEKSRT